MRVEGSNRTPAFKIVHKESDTSLEHDVEVIDLQPEEKELSYFRQLMQYKPDVTVCDIYGESPIFIALLKNRKDILKILLNVENLNTRLHLNEHLFDVLIHLRRADVKLNEKDDVGTVNKRIWPLHFSGESYKTVFQGEYELLNHMLTLGLNVNQNIQIYADCKLEEDLECKPLLYRLIYSSAYELVQKVELLLDAKADVNIRVQQPMDVMAFNTEDCNPVLDKCGISVLEMTRRRILCENTLLKMGIYTDEKVLKYKDVLSHLKKRIRRYSV